MLEPPYSSETNMPKSPISPIFFVISTENRSSRSNSSASGAITPSANSRTEFLRILCSSVRSKLSMASLPSDMKDLFHRKI